MINWHMKETNLKKSSILVRITKNNLKIMKMKQKMKKRIKKKRMKKKRKGKKLTMKIL